jgi:hypothetical protein
VRAAGTGIFAISGYNLEDGSQQSLPQADPYTGGFYRRLYKHLAYADL